MADGESYRIGEDGYIILAALSILAAGFLVPILGVIATVCGVQLYRNHDKRFGVAFAAGSVIVMYAAAVVV